MTYGYVEKVFSINAEGSTLGVLSLPQKGATENDLSVIVLNAGLMHRIGPFRMFVQLAREIAEAGLAVLRLDLAGKGDSAMPVGGNYKEAICRNFEDFTEVLEKDENLKRFILVGLCSGADDALELACKYESVVGVVLLDGYSHRTPGYYMRQVKSWLSRPGDWPRYLQKCVAIVWFRIIHFGGRNASSNTQDLDGLRYFGTPREMRKKHASLVSRGCKLLCVFTAGASVHYNYPGQLKSALKLPRHQANLTEVYFPFARHTYPLLVHRKRLFNVIVGWLSDNFTCSAHQSQESH